MTRARRRAAAALALAIGGAGALYFYLSSSKPKSEKKVSTKTFCLLVDGVVDLPALLAQYPDMVVVGTAGVSLKAGGAEDYRLIETETSEGWIHVIKQLRPPQLIIPDQAIVPENLDRFVKSITRYSAADLSI